VPTVSIEVAPVTADRVKPVAASIARGFLDNEVWVWIVPSERRLARLLPRYYAMLIRRVFIPRGEAWMTEDAKAGALWYPPSEDPHLTAREQLREIFTLLPIGVRGLLRGARSEDTMRKHHPSEPHYYLLTLSVDPEHQRRGHGGALLRPVLERADAERMPSYLETQRESNVPYYARFGFELTERVDIPDGPPIWLMWREPRPGAIS
jgi:GNAT superfamily N-acetyltransferase